MMSSNIDRRISRPGLIHIAEAVRRTKELTDNNQDTIIGIPSGFASLDKMTNGWQPGDLIVIGARPSVGKTTFALNLARNAAVDHNIPVAFFSLQLSAFSLTKRLFVSESETTLENSPLYIDDSPMLTTEDIIEKVKDLTAEHAVKLVIIDFLHLIRDWDLRETNESILIRLKEAASKYKVAIIALSYVLRPIRKNYTGPILSDLDVYCPYAVDFADKIILLHRPSLMSPDYQNKEYDLLDVRLVKNNTGDITGVMAGVGLLLDKKTLRITEQ
jgi:replicative DNA helicase